MNSRRLDVIVGLPTSLSLSNFLFLSLSLSQSLSLVHLHVVDGLCLVGDPAPLRLQLATPTVSVYLFVCYFVCLFVRLPIFACELIRSFVWLTDFPPSRRAHTACASALGDGQWSVGSGDGVRSAASAPPSSLAARAAVLRCTAPAELNAPPPTVEEVLRNP